MLVCAVLNWYEPAALTLGKIQFEFNQILGMAFLLDHVFLIYKPKSTESAPKHALPSDK